MRRLDRKAIEAEIAVRMKMGIRANKRALLSKLTIESEAAIDAIVAQIIEQLDNEQTCVMRTDRDRGGGCPMPLTPGGG